jgi:hypothetical protein
VDQFASGYGFEWYGFRQRSGTTSLLDQQWANIGDLRQLDFNQLAAEGSYSVGLRAIDNAGNISALSTSSFGIDATPPAMNIAANRR